MDTKPVKESRSPKSFRERMFLVRRQIAKAGNLAGRIVLFPFKIFAIPLHALNLLHNTGVKTSLGEHTHVRKRDRILQVVAWPFRLLFLPLRLISESFRQGRQRELVFLIPPGIALAFLGFVAFQLTVNGQSIKRRYFIGARRAINNADYGLAKTYFRRVLDRENLSDPETLQWAQILASTDESERAIKLLDQIAPNDSVGYEPAHQFRATLLARQFDMVNRGDANQQTTVDSKPEINLEHLKWHLDHSGDPTAASNHAWATYFVALNQPETAIQFLEKAATEFPDLYLLIAQIAKENGLDDQRDTALRMAESRFSNLLNDHPLNSGYRKLLADTLVELGKFNLAESVLQTGLSFNSAPFLKQVTSNFYIVRFDKSAELNEPLSARIRYLHQALATDREFPTTYRRLVDLTMNLASEDEFSDRRSELLEIVAGNRPTGIDHCNLGHLYWKSNNQSQAIWHLNQAWRLNSQLGPYANPLAETFAYIDTPDLEWASMLARKTIEESPETAAYHETLGSILLIQEKFDEAIVELEIALENSNMESPKTEIVGNQSKLHEKLAHGYDKIGNQQKARQHAKAARQ